MREVFEERRLTVFVNPNLLRRLATEMEKFMSEAVVIGGKVWTHDFGSGESRVRLLADQDWFNRRAGGFLDWDETTPGPEALARFKALDEVLEVSEFPDTYSGAAWHAAYRVWRAVKTDPEKIDQLKRHDAYAYFSSDMKGLDLTGFMAGWAVNAVRHMLGLAPGPNPAIVEIGAGDDQPVVPASGSPESDLRKALGG
jgi:hypothetical protein